MPCIQWINRDTTSASGERALARALKNTLVPSMRVLACKLSDATLREIAAAGERHGFSARQALALRRNLLKCAMGMRAFQALDGNSHEEARAMATAFERLLQRHVQAANPGVRITTEDERKARHRALASDDPPPLGPTPDLTFDPPICINGRAIGWIDAKFMYGCFETRRKSWQPESRMRAAAQKYTAVFGAGAFVFANGFCRELEGWLGGEALLLDASPLDAEMQQLHEAIEEARAGDAGALASLCRAVDSLAVAEAAPSAAA